MSTLKQTMTMLVDHSTQSILPEDIDLYRMCIRNYESGARVTVTIEPFVRSSTPPQRNLMHKYISVISDSTGNEFQEAKDILKMKYGARNEDGSVKSTTLYSTVEMSKFIDKLYNFGVTELGLKMPNPQDLKSKNIK